MKRLTVFGRDGWRCGICGEDVDPTLAWPHPESAVLDHIIPLIVQGSPGHVWSNVQCAHNECNRRKGTKFDPELLAALSV